MGSRSGLGRASRGGPAAAWLEALASWSPHRDLRKNCYYFPEFKLPERRLLRQ